VAESGQRGARGCNADCEGDVDRTGCDVVAVNESCEVALVPGSSEENDWLRKSVEEEDPGPACE
jgi:hypothetical protein